MEDQTALDVLFTQLIAAVPLLVAVIVPAALDWFKEHITKLVPTWAWPVLLVVGGAALSTVAKLVGYDIGDFNAETADLTTWQTAIMGALVGASTIGLRQVWKQLADRLKKPPTPTE